MNTIFLEYQMMSALEFPALFRELNISFWVDTNRELRVRKES